MEKKALDMNEIALKVADMLRPEILRVLDIGAMRIAEGSCCEDKCPCNERCSGSCTCNVRCGCEGRTAANPCDVVNAVVGLPIESIDTKSWNQILEHMNAVHNIRGKILSKTA